MNTIEEIYRKSEEFQNREVLIAGWVRNNRDQKEFGFIDLNDGTCFSSIQVVYDSSIENFKDIQKYRNGSSVEVKGELVLTPSAKQPFEIKAKEITLLGDSGEDYPIQPKRHSREFLREKLHLRARTNLFNAIFRLRSEAAYAIHTFFHSRGFIYVHTPIITSNDGEGAGELFNITTASPNPETDFFGKKVYLTVTGQLHVEAFAMAYRNVYTFGPTFRAENSNTTVHASEFWMIEPEIAFADLTDEMNLAEDLLKYVIDYVLKNCSEEMKFFDAFVEKGLIDKLTLVLNSKEFKRITHKEAIDLLLASGINFENAPGYKKDLATEHEKYLTSYFKSPVFVYDWPKDIKAFYMRMNDDNETVAASDLLVPGSGEIVGGSQREERLDLLLKRMSDLHMNEKTLDWYVDLRRYGGCKHSGFGLGFERLLMYLSGVDNIRDVEAYPRNPNNCDF
ncbi:MAG: asparagine--tRNA ligase [Bacillales bacterium]|nr:asparagine--tRNA ligase [Bacillales bacterium]